MTLGVRQGLQTVGVNAPASAHNRALRGSTHVLLINLCQAPPCALRSRVTAPLTVQVEGVSMTRFFVPSQGDTDRWTTKEMRLRDDFVYLDLAATYQTIGVQTVLRLWRSREEDKAHSMKNSCLISSDTLCEI